MKVRVQETNDVVLLRLEGALTSEACNRLRLKVTELMTVPRKAIVFELAEVPFIDSAGLELLLWTRDYCQLSVVQFRLADLPPHVAKILEMTRLDQEFHCGNGLNEAVSSLT